MDFWRSIKKVIKCCTVDLSKTPDSDKGGNGVLHEEVRTGTEVPAGGAGHQESGEVCSRKDRWVQVGVS